MNKNIGSFLAFDKNWFEKNQKILLWFLNTPVIKYWTRWILRIKKCDCSSGVTIIKLTPNSFTVVNRILENKIQFQTDFRTHPKFSKRIYFAFKYVWWIMHFWDWILADGFIPKWAFGFSTLTVYPDANPETTSVDGLVEADYANGSGKSWANLIADLGTGGYPSLTGNEVNDSVAGFTTDSLTTDFFRTLRRLILLFDTSSIGDTDTIDSGILSIKGNSKTDGLVATPDVNIYSSAPASNTDLVAGDFDSLGSTAFATAITYANWNTAAYNDFTLNASGLANISKTGVSKFGVRNANYDVAGVIPPWSNVVNTRSTLGGWHADRADTTEDPKLVVTYTVATSGPANMKTWNNLAKASVKTMNGLAIASIKTWDGLA